MNYTADVGHMKKNCNIHAGCYMSLESTQLITMGFKMMEVVLFRSRHSFNKRYFFLFLPIASQPFGTCQISAATILSMNNEQSHVVPVTITDPDFASVSCSLTIRIQKVSIHATFSLPVEMPFTHVPVATKLEITRGEIQDTDWNARYYGKLVFPNRDVFVTDPVLGITPGIDYQVGITIVWKKAVILKEPALKQLTCTFELYRKTETLDVYIGSAVCNYSRPKHDIGNVNIIRVDVWNGMDIDQ